MPGPAELDRQRYVAVDVDRLPVAKLHRADHPLQRRHDPADQRLVACHPDLQRILEHDR